MHDLVMPYVTVASRGGPHDDASFVAGWTCGRLDAQLATIAAARATVTVHVTAEVAPQLDLIAMRHRYTAEVRDPDPVTGLVEARLQPEHCPSCDT